MSGVKEKVKEKTHALESICEKLVSSLSAHLDEGIQNADTDEVGKVADIIKDLCEAKEDCVKAMYHEQIMEAMEENEYGEEWDEYGPLRGYRGRSATTGRYVHRAYNEGRDMDRASGRMYYTDGKMASETRYGIAKKGYEEAVDHTEKREKLQHLMDALEQDLVPYAPQMDANDKAIVKNGLQKLMNKFN